MFTAVGHQVLNVGFLTASVCRIISASFAELLATALTRQRAVIQVLQRQVYFSGVEVVGVVSVFAAIVGVAIISQILGVAGTGSGFLTGRILVWLVVREFGPLVTAIVLAGRSGTAIATETAAMKVNGEIETLEMLGISCSRYLVMPRVMGMGFSSALLSVYFQVTAMIGSLLVVSLIMHVPFDLYRQGILAELTLAELAVSLLKSLLFGLVVGACCCREGLLVGKSVTQIPQAAARAIMQSLFLVFFVDALFSIVFLLG